MHVEYKFWIVEDETIFGDGAYRLLNLIDKNGSISQATSEMDISYRKAWDRIRKMEKRYNKTLVKTHTVLNSKLKSVQKANYFLLKLTA